MPPAAARCVVCGRSRPAVDAARCPVCATGPVTSQVCARRIVPVVRSDLAAIGIALRTRVRVRLVAPDDLGTPRPGVLGLTEQRWYEGDAARRSVEIRIVLTPTRFGRVVAHEVGHAWLGERGSWLADARIEEGVCELFASAWLKSQRTPSADALRDQLRHNPDPVYGDGFRIIEDAVVRHGVGPVLDAVTNPTL